MKQVGWAAIAAVMVAVSATSAAAQSRKPPPASDMSELLRDAQDYTVKVRSTVTWPIEGERFGAGQGTGFVIDKARGWILTNAHVARSSPGAVDVAFSDAETEWTPVERVYVDNVLDIAILKIAPDRAPPQMKQARLGCNRAVEQGAAVVAYGHPRDLNFTATRGIVSSVRTLGALEYIQMDASLNPGNSGGALLGVDHAEVIGVTTATAGNGLGFATPIRHICPVLDLLRAGKDPTVPTLPIYWLRVGNGETLTVANAFPNAPADFAIRSGDEVLGLVGGLRVAGVQALSTALRGRTGAVRLIVRRAGAEIEVAAPLIREEPRLQRQALAIAGMLIDDDRRVDAESSVLSRLHIDFLKSGEVAELAGFRVGDTIVEIGGQSFANVADLHAFLKSRAPGSNVKVLIRRRTGSPNGMTTEHLRLELKVLDLALVSGAS
jgi:serine protease Do